MEAEPLQVAGHRAEYWITLFFACHHILSTGMGGATVLQWRTLDGRPHLAQPAIQTQIFQVILGEVRQHLNPPQE